MVESKKSNLVQTEFFFDRPGMPIKSAIRFFDDQNRVTELVQNFMRSQTQEMEWLKEFARLNGLAAAHNSQEGAYWEKIDAGRKANHACLTKIKLRNLALPVVLNCLKELQRTSSPIAVELPDRSFRAALLTEFDGLIHSARIAIGAWVFIFKPNDLLADKNEPVASLI